MLRCNLLQLSEMELILQHSLDPLKKLTDKIGNKTKPPAGNKLMTSCVCVTHKKVIRMASAREFGGKDSCSLHRQS